MPYFVLIDTSGLVVYESNSTASFDLLNPLLLDNGVVQNSCPDIEFTQNEIVPEGWNLLSKRVITDDESMESVFSEVASEMVILKDAAGDVYWPNYNLNTIGEYDSNKGYLAKFSNEVALSWSGILLSFDLPIVLNLGWNIIPYYAEESINSYITIVKYETGNVYLPSYNFNNIGALQHGKAYFIKVTQELEFQY